MTWSGHAVRAARAHFTPLLPLPCARCRLPVTGLSPWHVDHIVERINGGTDDLSNLWPAHAYCNTVAGQAISAARRRRARAGLPTTTTRRRW